MRWVIALALWGCYSGNAEVGIPCSSEKNCPKGQFCDLARTPPLCELTPLDAAVDAPVACSVAANMCPAETPICDTSTMTCRRCTADADCTQSDACAETTGTCVAESGVIYVETTGDDSGMCTRTMPCANITRALEVVTATRNFIRLGAGEYPGGHSIAKTVTLSGPSVSAGARISRAALGPTLQVTGAGVTLGVEAVQLVNAGGNAIDANTGTTVKVFATVIDSAQGQGISANAATIEVRQSNIVNCQRNIEVSNNSNLTINRTIISTSQDFAVHVSSSAYNITSSLFVDNHRGVNIDGTIVGGSKFDFNTVVGTTNDRAFRCGNPGPIASNSIFANNNPPAIDTGRCALRYSLVSDAIVSGTGNLTGDPGFVMTGDYHLATSSKAIDAADPQSTEPTDFDGRTRPRGIRRDMGAYEH